MTAGRSAGSESCWTRRPARSSDGFIATRQNQRSEWPQAKGFELTGNEKRLVAPITEEQMRALKVGDVVLISGEMYTGRDAVHSYLMKHEPPVDLQGFGALPLRTGGDERQRQLQDHRRRSDDQHSRRAVSSATSSSATAFAR